MVDKLCTNETNNIPASFINLETNVDDLDVGKFKTVAVDFKKSSDRADKEIMKLFKIQNSTH